MFTRRTIIATAGATITGALAGCASQAIPDEFEATAATVSTDALDTTGYEDQGTQPQETTREFQAGGDTQTVTVTNYQSSYDKPVTLPGAQSVRAAQFVVLSSPQISVLGQEFNPINDWGHREFVTQLQSESDRLGDLQQTDEAQTTLLGETATVGRYTGQATYEDLETPIDIVMRASAPVSDGGDFILAAGSYPAGTAETEAPNVDTLFGAVVHET